MSDTRRERCSLCDPDGRKGKARAVTRDDLGEVWKCHRCGDSGHVPHAHGHRTVSRTIEVSHAKPDLAAIVARTLPWRGSLVEVYLGHRRCALLPADGDVRFLPGNDRYPPTMVGLVTNVETGALQSLHFTRLAPDGKGKAGTDRDKLLLRGHPKKNGCIRLWPNEAVTHGLGVAEGIETALSLAHAYRPVWALIDAGNLASMPVLPGVESLVIAADNDPPGLAAARACGSRWAAAGREARLVIPEQGDVNDAVAA